MSDGEKNDVAIFWDYENCPVPAHCEPFESIQHLVKLAESFGNLKTFYAYTEPCKLGASSSLHSTLNLYHGQLITCPHNGKMDVVDKKLLVDMLIYALDNAPPCTIILISGDGDFTHAVEQLRERGYEMVMIAAINRHPTLCQAASRAFDWRAVLGFSDSEPELLLDSGDDEKSSDSTSSNESWNDEFCTSPKENPNDCTILSPNVESTFNTDSSEDLSFITSEEISKLFGHLDVGSEKITNVPTSYYPLVKYLAEQEAKGNTTPRRSAVGSALASEKAIYEKAGFHGFREYVAHAEELGLVELGGVGDAAWVGLNAVV